MLGSVDVGEWKRYSESVHFDPEVAPCALSNLNFGSDSMEYLKVAFDPDSMTLDYSVATGEIGQFQATIRAFDQGNNILMEKAVLWKVIDPHEVHMVKSPVKIANEKWESKILVLTSVEANSEDFLLSTIPQIEMDVKITSRNTRSWWFEISGPLTYGDSTALKVVLQDRVGRREIAQTTLILE